MNTKTKTFGFVGIIGLTLLVVTAYVMSSKQTENQRKIASLIDQANPDWSNGQKLKWAVTKQFNIQIYEQELTIDTPMVADLCTDNHGIAIKLKASEVMVAGLNPEIKIVLGCDAWLTKPDFKIQVNLNELAALHNNKELKSGDLQISRTLIYKDDEWPTDWTLTAIEIVGPNGFVINQFELQEALQKLFVVTIQK